MRCLQGGRRGGCALCRARRPGRPGPQGSYRPYLLNRPSHTPCYTEGCREMLVQERLGSGREFCAMHLAELDLERRRKAWRVRRELTGGAR